MRKILGALGLACESLVAAGSVPARAQSDPELKALYAQVTELYRGGKYSEAILLAQRYVDVAKARHGPDHPEYASALSQLRLLLKTTNPLSEAEPLYRRALAIYETSLGPEHPYVAAALNNLARLLRDATRLGKAEPLMRRAIAIDEQSYGPEHPEVATDLNKPGAAGGMGTDRNCIIE